MFRKALVVGTLLAAVAVAGAGYAAIPNSSTGVISSCYPKSTSARVLRVIDAQAGESCKPNEQPLHWSQQGPIGPAGPQGPIGPEGPAGSGGGLSGYQFVLALSLDNSETRKSKKVNCPAGQKVVGGGGTGRAMTSSDLPLAIVTSYPVGPNAKEPGAPYGWFVEVKETSATSASWSVWAFAICVDA